MSNCVHLLKRSGNRYRVFNEIEGRQAFARDDPWDLVLPGRSGFVAAWGDDRLVACTHSTITTRRILAAVEGAVIVQDGDDGANIAFPAERLDVVAPILRLRRRRQAAAADHLRKFAFNPRLQVAVSPQIPPIDPAGGGKPHRGEIGAQ
jgi:hypothetical protein